MKKCHPDKFPNDKQKNLDATENSKIINEAYRILKDYEPPNTKGQIDYSPHYATKESKKGKQGIVRERVKSSNIHSVGYESNEIILQIQFLDGGIYEYYGVQKDVFNELMKTESKGKFAIRYIYYSYRYERVG